LNEPEPAKLRRSRHDIRQALADDFLVCIQALAGALGQCAGDDHALHQSEKRDCERTRQQFLDHPQRFEIEARPRPGEKRQ
jgi:hypothetical protein